MSLADKRTLRACMLCSILLPERVFAQAGCPNCQEIMEAAGAGFEEYTSPMYEGTVAMIEPSDSWVAKWQRYENFTPGMYAIKVTGRLAEDVQSELERRRINYRPRDGSVQE